MHLTYYLKVLKVGLLVSFIVSCTTIPNEVVVKSPTSKWNLPLVKGDLGFADLALNDSVSMLSMDETEGYYKILYSSTQQSKPAEELISIPNQEVITNFSFGTFLPGATIPVGETLTSEFHKNASIGFEDASRQLSLLKLKQGEVLLTFESTYQHDLKLDITFPGLLDMNNQPVKRTAEINHTISTNASVSILLDESYTIHLDKETNGASTVNNFPVIINARLEGSGNEVLGSQSLSCKFNLNNPKFKLMQGLMGTIEIPEIKGDFPFALFQTLDVEEFSIYPTLNLNFINSFGIPIKADMNGFYVKKSDDSQGMIVSPDFVENKQFNYPLLPSVENEITNFNASKDNSNLNELFSVKNSVATSAITYAVTLESGDNPSSSNFVRDDSHAEFELEMEIPIGGRIKELKVSNKFPLNDLPASEELQSIYFIMELENYFPFVIDLQGVFLDADGNVLGNLFEEENGRASLVTAPELDLVDSRVTKPSTNLLTVKMDKERFKNIENATQLRLTGFISTPSDFQSDVKIYEESKMIFKMGASVELLPTSNDNK